MLLWVWTGGHINPAVTFGLFLARKLSLTRAVFYIVMQCLGAICGAGVVKGFEKGLFESSGGGANAVNHGYTKGDGLGAEIIGTFVLVYTVFSATDAKRNARDSHVPVSIFLCFFVYQYLTLVCVCARACMFVTPLSMYMLVCLSLICCCLNLVSMHFINLAD